MANSERLDTVQAVELRGQKTTVPNYSESAIGLRRANVVD